MMEGDEIHVPVEDENAKGKNPEGAGDLGMQNIDSPDTDDVNDMPISLEDMNPEDQEAYLAAIEATRNDLEELGSNFA